MLKALKKAAEGDVETAADWLELKNADFKKRFLSLLSHEFRDIDV